VISYCIACYRPTYTRELIDELIRKTSTPYEILLWLNIDDAAFERFLANLISTGVPLHIVGRTPENIGMAAYPSLFVKASFDLVVQIDDDVVCVSPGIAEQARMIFDRFPQVGMLTADVWQDEYTTGARPPMSNYRLLNRECGLYLGPIDGWFAVYRKASLAVCRGLCPARYYPLGCVIKQRLQALGQSGVLCTRMKVFHVIGPAYASYFGMLDSEIVKYSALGRNDIVNWYRADRDHLPSREHLGQRIRAVRENLAHLP
jgi:hypothetical protein